MRGCRGGGAGGGSGIRRGAVAAGLLGSGSGSSGESSLGCTHTSMGMMRTAGSFFLSFFMCPSKCYPSGWHFAINRINQRGILVYRFDSEGRSSGNSQNQLATSFYIYT
jgi:hypothetical protein